METEVEYSFETGQARRNIGRAQSKQIALSKYRSSSVKCFKVEVEDSRNKGRAQSKNRSSSVETKVELGRKTRSSSVERGRVQQVSTVETEVELSRNLGRVQFKHRSSAVET